MRWNANLKKLNKNLKSFDSKCKMMRVKVVLEDMGARENGARV
jgi:hypothetical protein